MKKLYIKSIALSIMALAMTAVSAPTWAVDVTFQLPDGASVAGNPTFGMTVVMKGGTDTAHGNTNGSCKIKWNTPDFECTISVYGDVGYAGTDMGGVSYQVDVYWHFGDRANPTNTIGKISFWMTVPKGHTYVQIPTAQVEFRTADAPVHPNEIWYYMASSGDVANYRGMTNPSSPNNANASKANRVGTLRWNNTKDELTVLAGCYTVSFLQKLDGGGANSAKKGGLEETKVLCVGEDDYAEVKFTLDPVRTLKIEP